MPPEGNGDGVPPPPPMLPSPPPFVHAAATQAMRHDACCREFESHYAGFVACGPGVAPGVHDEHVLHAFMIVEGTPEQVDSGLPERYGDRFATG